MIFRQFFAIFFLTVFRVTILRESPNINKNLVLVFRKCEKMAQEKSTISRLNEICQQWKFPLPVYREAEGNYQQFGTEVTLTLEDDVLGFHALGRTKKISKTNVADKAIFYIEENYPHLLKPPPLPELEPSASIAQPLLKKTQLNKQKEAPVNMHELAKETEELSHVTSGLDMARIIQQSRMKAKLTQKELAARINEKVHVVNEYEQGKAILNGAIIKKFERVLGVYLTGAKTGQPLKQH